MHSFRLHLAAAFCALSVALFGTSRADAADTVVIFPPTDVGAAIDLVQTTTRERSVKGQPATTGSSTTPVHLEVLAASDDETVMGWTIGRAKIEGPRFNPQVADVTDPLIDLIADQTIELVLDEQFTPAAIRNLDHMMALSQKMVGELEKTLPDGEAKAAAIPRIREMVSNRETTQNLMLQQPGRYFLVYGWELEPGQPRQVDMLLPSPFGGEPLPAQVTIELMPWNDADEHLVVAYRQDLDQAAVQRLIQDAMKKLAGDSPIPPDQFPKFDVQDRGEFRINRSTGWVDDAVVTRTTRANEGSQIDTLEFRRAK